MKARVWFALGMVLAGLGQAAEYDVLVAGGGPAGIGAGYMAARRGAKVLVIEKSGRLGGMAVQAMVSPFSIATDSPVVCEIAKRIKAGSSVDFSQTDILAYDLLTSVGADVLLHATVLGPVMEGNRVTGLEVLCADGKKIFKGKVAIDATGNGDVALAAGVPFEMGRTSDKLVQPMSIMYTIGGVEQGKRFFCGSEEHARKVVVPGTGKTWEAIVQEAIKNGELPPEVGVIRLYRAPFPTGNVINATQVNGLYGTKSEDLTKAEIICRKQAVQVLNVMRKNLPGYANAYIATMPAVIGVRETRRFEGVERLEVEDCLTGRKRTNAIARRCCFVIDIHNPTGGGQAENQSKDAVTGQARRVKPYDIPYGAIVPKKVDGLLLSGRCLSASHEALASCRVMGNAMATGIGAGAAAAWAVRNQIDVRDVPAEKLDLFTLDSPLNVR
ncbi:MAG: FAD-dependent oxidoreductase [Kiritimatiellae bacterium]|nr:FAD-dependent oxidoreductase [Kiritimatiellia bacterium]